MNTNVIFGKIFKNLFWIIVSLSIEYSVIIVGKLYEILQEIICLLQRNTETVSKNSIEFTGFKLDLMGCSCSITDSQLKMNALREMSLCKCMSTVFVALTISQKMF